MISLSHGARLYFTFPIAALLLVLFPTPSLASDVLILTPQNSSAANQTLKQALDSQLMDYDRQSELVLLDSRGSANEIELEEAKKYIWERNGIAAIWLNETQFFLYIQIDGDSHFFSRPLPAQTTSWEVQCDAIASVIHATLFPWLSDSDVPIPPPADSQSLQPKPEIKSPPSAKRPAPKPKISVDRRVQPGLGIAFQTWLMSTNNLWSNGATALFSTTIQPHMVIEADGGVATDTSRGFRMIRIPVRLRTEYYWNTASIRLGLGVSLLADIVTVSPEIAQNGKDVRELYWGAGASASFMYKVNPLVSLVVRAGADIFQSSNSYEHQAHLVFHYGALQGSSMAGIIFWLR